MSKPKIDDFVGWFEAHLCGRTITKDEAESLVRIMNIHLLNTEYIVKLENILTVK